MSMKVSTDKLACCCFCGSPLKPGLIPIGNCGSYVLPQIRKVHRSIECRRREMLRATGTYRAVEVVLGDPGHY